MSRQQAVHVMAGSMILIGLILAWTITLWFLLLPLFVGLNLFQWGFTGFCPAEKIFARLGLKCGPCE
jgi:hypothetical protein